MTKEQFYQGLSEVVETFYGKAPMGQALPYAVYTWDHDNNFPADDVVYQPVATITVNLYAVDPAIESAVDAKLTEMGLFWTSTSSFELDDDAYLTIYTMEEFEDEES